MELAGRVEARRGPLFERLGKSGGDGRGRALLPVPDLDEQYVGDARHTGQGAQ